MKQHPIRRPISGLAVALLLAACGDTVEPPDDLLAGVDEMAVYTAVVERVSAFNHTAEANANLRLALGTAIPPAHPIPAELFGHTLAYDVDTDAWEAEASPTLPDDVLRVTWHEVSGSFVAVPVSVRGYIDLTRRADPTLSRLDVRAVRTDGTQRTLADYTARFGDEEAGSQRTRLFHATGWVSDGERPLQFDTRTEEVESVASGDATTGYRLALTDQGFGYAAELIEARTGAQGPTAVEFSASASVQGVETRLRLELVESPSSPLAGSGTLHYDGRHIALVEVAGSQMTFNRPDGTPFRQVDQQRLGTLVSVLFIPISVVEPYFS